MCYGESGWWYLCFCSGVVFSLLVGYYLGSVFCCKIVGVLVGVLVQGSVMVCGGCWWWFVSG